MSRPRQMSYGKFCEKAGQLVPFKLWLLAMTLLERNEEEAVQMNMLEDFENSHVKYLRRKFDQLDERRKEGMRYTAIEIEQLQIILSETIGLHQRLTWIEKFHGMSMAVSTKPLDFFVKSQEVSE